MNEIDLLRHHGENLNSQPTPAVDITARVLRTIRARREPRWSDSLRPLTAVLAASWLTVLVTGFFVEQAWSELQDPLASFLTPFVVALQ